MLDAAAGIWLFFRSGIVLRVTKDSAVFEVGGARVLDRVARGTENDGFRVCAGKFLRRILLVL